MEPLTISALISIATAASAAIGSYGATKATLNGTKERVERIEDKLDGHITETRQHRDDTIQRLSRLETKVID